MEACFFALYCFMHFQGCNTYFFLFLSILINWWAGIRLGREKKEAGRKKIFVIVLIYDIAILAVFKYLNLLDQTFCSLGSLMFGKEIQPVIPALILPVGISFFTFQIMSYLIDVYRRKEAPQTSLADLALYIMLFPQLIAGPIVRYSDIDYFDSIEYINNHVFDERVPLFYKTGFHWSAYTGNCVGAGFGEYLREKTGYRFPKVSIAAEPCGEPFFPDADCFYGMNILKPPYENYYKPVVTVEEEGLDKPGFLCRGGSFMGQSLSMLIENDYFGKNVHMENINLFTDKFTNITSFYDYDSIDLPELLKGIDIVVLEVNEPAVSNMSFGFIDYLLEHPETISEE